MKKVRVKFTDQAFGFNPLDNCYTRALQKRYEVVFSDDPQLVFYSCFGTEFLAYPDRVRVFLANEPVLPNFNDCDYAIGAMEMSFGSRYFRQIPILNYGEMPYWKYMKAAEPLSGELFTRNFCNFIYANEYSGRGAYLRKEFCKALSQYRHVDCPGRVLNNMSGALALRYPNNRLRSEKDFNHDWSVRKIEFLRDYKFTIAFENVSMPGFTTEKLIHPLIAHSIPIYWGDPLATKYFNPKAFINCADYGDDFDAVIHRIIELDKDEKQYMDMLYEPPLKKDFPHQWEDDLADYLSTIVDGGCRPLDKNPMGFPSMSTQDYSTLCREGKVGMRDILRRSTAAMAGWLHYKMHKR